VDWSAFDQELRTRRRRILERFVECLRVDTVSQQPARVRAGAEWLVRAMARVGLEARVLPTSGNPVVFGERRVPGASRTLLIYCHFDNRQHSPNEHIRLDHLYQGIRTTARLLVELGQ
jgi:acetylornithine deacetylase/succinyl-diaminopimelate desuccinylase-like protein